MTLRLTKGSFSYLMWSLGVFGSCEGSRSFWLRTEEASLVYSDAIFVKSDGWFGDVDLVGGRHSWCWVSDHFLVVSF